jgi:2-polyprenyl-6-methoxyphenol hydroxylase-like FAD-dependent oxidoreductase
LNTQVAIVGAGPTGLTLALQLAQRGIAVTLIDAAPTLRRVFRGEALMPSGLEAIAQLGLTDLIPQIPHRALDTWAFYLEKRPLFQVKEPLEPGGQPCTLISQPAFLEAVLAKASQYAHFAAIQGTAVQDLCWQAERVTGIQLTDGRKIQADLVIGADGRMSTVRQRADLGLKQQPQGFDILWFKLPSTPQFAQDNVFYSMVCGRDAFGCFQGAEGNLQLGWSLHQDDPLDWRQIDWAEKLAAVSPPGLAAHFRQHRQAIERPLLLSIVVGWAPLWHRPGLLILGDAAHPMSPIRAQGINMALRDVIVAVNHLLPCLRQQPGNLAHLDAVLPLIQAERQPEISRIQQLQAAEIAQARLLRSSALLRFGVSRLAPLIGPRIRQSWLQRQLLLREGVVKVDLKR